MPSASAAGTSADPLLLPFPHAAVRFDEDIYLVDCGEGTRNQVGRQLAQHAQQARGGAEGRGCTGMGMPPLAWWQGTARGCRRLAGRLTDVLAVHAAPAVPAAPAAAAWRL